ncbi:MAG: hypothetical protein H7296_07500 [Bacteroidia bacterium]|nr:hypothetical protein [Bacteroidia bacterium]
MISVTNFKLAVEIIKADIPLIGSAVIVAHEQHLVNKLRDKAGVVLGAMYPNLERTGQADATIDTNVTWFFILEKMITGATDAQEEAQYQKLQTIALAVLSIVNEESGACSIFFKRQEPTCSMVPEFNEFGGFNGWSFSISF